jgi:hypothetical protein
VTVGGPLADDELFGNDAIRPASRDEHGHFPLADGQRQRRMA